MKEANREKWCAVNMTLMAEIGQTYHIFIVFCVIYIKKRVLSVIIL